MAGVRDSARGNGERFQDESLGRGGQAGTGASRRLLPVTLGFLVVGTAVSLVRRRQSQEGAESTTQTRSCLKNSEWGIKGRADVTNVRLMFTPCGGPLHPAHSGREGNCVRARV